MFISTVGKDLPHRTNIFINVGKFRSLRMSTKDVKLRCGPVGFTGMLKCPYRPGAKSYYAIVNGIKFTFPVYVNAGDMVSIVAVMGDENVKRNSSND